MKIFIANWKMHKTRALARAFLDAFIPQLQQNTTKEVWIAPPFTALELASHYPSIIKFGAQNFYPADSGAFTGEVSAEMIKELGGSFVLVGHSERRQLFHETDDFIHAKMKHAIQHQLLPVLCVGELIEDREKGRAFGVIESQIRKALEGISPESIVLAYEPVWAIGSGKSASPEIAQEMHAFCRSILKSLGGSEWAAKTPILYGGSVNLDNCQRFVQEPDVNGVLVGGASLEAEKFIQMIRGGL